MHEYEIIESSVGEITSSVIKRTGDDGVFFIPMDEGNTDYQAYLAWLEEKK